MNDEYISQTELGRLYRVSSHVVGRWLKGMGLRTESGRPSPMAFREHLVTQHPGTQPGTYYYVWHRQKVCELFDGMDYPGKAG